MASNDNKIFYYHLNLLHYNLYNNLYNKLNNKI